MLTTATRLARPLSVLVLLALAGTIVSACKLKKKDTDPTDDPPIANAPTVTVGGTGAKNESNVLRYQTETKLPNVPGVIARSGTKVREFPQSGKEVAVLDQGIFVTELAKYFSSGTLILFDDPVTKDGTKLLGWIEPSNLIPPTAAIATTTATAVATTTAVATAAKAVDAGVAAKDAGTTAVDAGAAVAPGVAIQVAPLAGNKCPAGFELMGPFCRRPCTSDASCPKGTFCTSASGRKSCSATR